MSNQTPKYTTADALKIASELEPILAQNGLHVAIGGSLVYRGTSEKDIDIFIYPHSRETPMDLKVITSILNSAGYIRRVVNDETTSTMVPDVWTASDDKGRNVDFFFMSRVERDFVKSEGRAE